MSSRRNSSKQRIALTDFVFLKCKLNGEIRTGSITLDYEYDPEQNTLYYHEVRYSDSYLEAHVESNPQVLKNVDSYVRNRLLKREFNIPLT